MKNIRTYFKYIVCALLVLQFVAGPTVHAIENTFEVQLSIGTGVDSVAPSIPTGLSALAISDTEIDLAWNASTDSFGVTGYRIFRDGLILATTTSLTYADIGLTPSTLYSYTVEAFDLALNYSGQSVVATASTQATPVVPPVATTTSSTGGGSTGTQLLVISDLAVNPDTGSAIVSFSTNIAAYSRVYWGKTSDYELGSIAGLIYATDHQIMIAGLDSRTTYYLKVEATDFAGRKDMAQSLFVTDSVTITSPLPNPTNFRATPQTSDILVNWTNPIDPRFESVRLVKSDRFFPADINDGDVVYEGSASRFVDTDVVAGKTYYYAIFARAKDGSYSSGALTQARIGLPGEIVPPSTDPFANLTQATGVHPRIAALLLSDFEFIQEGKLLESIDGTVAINGGKNLTVRLAYNKVPEILKTIAISLTDPEDATKVFPFLLRINADKTYYEATIGSLGRSGKYPMAIAILDYKNQGLKRLTGELAALAFTAPILNQQIGHSWLWLLILLILAIIMLIVLSKKKQARRQVAQAALILLVVFQAPLFNISAFASSFFSVPVAHAAFNKQINYQGKLANGSNVTVADGSYNIRFKLYTQPVSATTSALWTETWCVSPDGGTTCDGTGTDNRIALTSGLFSTLLGSTTALSGVDFNQTLYLGVEIAGSGATPVWDGEMTPRKKLGAVPAAFVADTLDGLSSEQFLRSDAQNATSSATTFLSVLQSGAGKIFEFFGANSASVFTALSNGNVGVGTSTPYAKFSVNGQIVAAYLTATTTTASTFPYASTTALSATNVNVSGVASSTSLIVSNLNAASCDVKASATGVLSCGTDANSQSAASKWATSTDVNSIFYTGTGNVGIGTSTPYAKLSVVGQVVGAYFTATTSTASVFPYASTTALSATNINVSGIASSTYLVASYASTTILTSITASTTNQIVSATTTSQGLVTTGLASSTSLIVSNLNSVSCDVKASASGVLSCGTDANSTSAASKWATSTADATSIFFTGTGNVGIGSSTPYAKLSVSGIANQATPFFAIASTSDAAPFIQVASTSNFQIDGGIMYPVGKGSIVHGAGGALLQAPSSIFISGSNAYVAASASNALEIIDMSNPAAPVHKGSLADGINGANLAAPTTLFVSGNYAYVLAIDSLFNPVLEIVDISNSAAPVHKGYLLDGAGGALLTGATGIYVSGNYAYIAATGADALEIVDISNPAQPVHAGSLVHGTNGAQLQAANSVYVVGNYAYVTSLTANALEIVDVSNPRNPIHKGSLIHGAGGALLSSPYSVFVSGNYAYVASSGSNALEIVDISNPSAPVHKGSLSNGVGGAKLLSPQSVFVSGNYAYVASYSSNALEIVDISNPAAPVHKGAVVDGIGATNLGGPYSVFVSGNNAYVASLNDDAIQVIDVGAVNISNAQIGTLKVGNLSVDAYAQFNNNVLVKNSLNVGGNTLIDGILTVTGSTGTTTARIATTSAVLLGNVQIGTQASGSVTPYSRLSVYGGGTGSGQLFELANAASTTMARFLDDGTGYFLGNIGVGTTSPAWKLSVAGIGSFDNYARASYFIATSTTASIFPYASTTAISGVNADFSGNVGIGTTTPTSRLHIVGTQAGDSLVKINSIEHASSLVDADFMIKDSAGWNNVGLDSWDGGGSGKGYGAVIVGSNCSVNCRLGEIAGKNSSTTVRNASIIFQTDNLSSFNGEISLITGRNGVFSQGILIDSLGNVGVGTTSPAWKLSVTGIGSFDNYARASYFIATSTTASTFPYASTTALSSTNINVSGIASSTYLVASYASTTIFTSTIASTTNQIVSATTTTNGLSVLGLASSTSLIVSNLNAASCDVKASAAGVLSCGTDADTTQAASKWATSTDNISAFFTGTGNIGIGTTSPYAKLSVAGQIVANNIWATSTTAINYFGGSVGIGTTTPNNPLTVVSTADDNGIEWRNTSGTTLGRFGQDGSTKGRLTLFSGTNLRVDLRPGGQSYIRDKFGVGDNSTTGSIFAVTTGASIGTDYYAVAAPTDSLIVSGSVGIGTSTPYAKLSVVGQVAAAYYTATTTTASTFPYASTTALSATNINVSGIASSTTTFTSATTTTWGLITTGLASSTSLIVSNLNAASCDVKASTSGVLSCGTDATGGGASTDKWSTSTETTSIYFNGTGNVGIGTSTPYAKLSVVGQVVGAYFTATTTTASTFPYASTTAISGTNSNFSGIASSTTTFTSATTTTRGLVTTGLASSTSLIVSNLNAASCDVKASASGVLSCGTDANSGSKWATSTTDATSIYSTGTGSVLIGLTSTTTTGAKLAMSQSLVTVSTPTGAGATELLASGSYNASDFLNYRIYAYKVKYGKRYYSTSYSETGNVEDTVGGAAFEINWSDPTPGGSTGFIITRDYNFNGFANYYDTGSSATTITDDNGGAFTWVSGSPTLTPTTALTFYSYNDGTNFWGTYGGNGYFDTNIGIGVTSPVAMIDVSTTSASARWLRLGSNSTEGVFEITRDGVNSTNILKSGYGDFLISTGSGIATGATEKLRVTTGGNVGIGTTTPWRTLSVSGNSDLGSNALAGYFTATSTTASIFPYASTTALSATNINVSGIASSTSLIVSNLNAASCDVKASASGVLSCGTDATSAGGGTPSKWATSTTDTTSIFYTGSGNVGIGTTTPRALLSLYNSSVGFGGLLIQPSASDFIQNDDAAQILTTTSDGTAPFDLSGSLIYRPRVSATDGRSSHIFYSGSPSLERMRINASGVGIGTSSPYAMLSVAGQVVANNIWATSTTATNYFGANVGIGITNPLNQLSLGGYGAISGVTGNNTGYLTHQYGTSDGYDYLSLAGNFRRTDGNAGTIFTAAQAAAEVLIGTQTSDSRILFNTTQTNNVAPTERMRITGAGDVGIGTTTPYAKLSVVGQVVGAYFTATTTTASTFPYASTTAISGTNSNFSGIASSTTTFTSATTTTRGLVTTGLASSTSLIVSNLNAASCDVKASTSGVLSCGTDATGTGGSTDKWSTSTETTSIYFNGTGNVGIGTSTPYAKLSVVGQVAAEYFFATSTTATSTFAGNVIVGSGNLLPGSPFHVGGDVNTYLQANIRNRSAGNDASSDWVATNDIGSDSAYYIDMGINSSTYNNAAYTISGANDAYLYAQSNALAIGTATSSSLGVIKFHTGGTLSANERMRITSNGFVGIGTTSPWGHLSVVGNGSATGTPTFVVATTTGKAPLFYVTSTTTGALDWARVAIGTSTMGAAGLRDQLFVQGRINSSWHQISCEAIGMMGTAATGLVLTADTARACGDFHYDVSTDSNLNVVVRDSGTGQSYIRLRGGVSPVAADSGALRTAGNAYMSKGESPVLESYVRVGTAPGSINSLFVVGFSTTTHSTPYSNQPITGTYFAASSTNTWVAITRQNSSTTETRTVTSIATSSFARLRIEVEPNRVLFLANGAVVAEHTTNLPTDNFGVQLSAAVLTGAGGVARDLDIGYIRVWSDDPPVVGGAQLAKDLEGISGTGPKISNLSSIDAVSGGSYAVSYSFDRSKNDEEGTLVSFDPNNQFRALTSTTTYDNNILGAISVTSAATYGLENVDTIKVATGGRGYVKVSLENGDIAVGDYITSSSVAGVAMKATRNGRVIGRALQAYDKKSVVTMSASGIPMIVVALEPIYYGGFAATTTASVAHATTTEELAAATGELLATSTSFVGKIAQAVQSVIQSTGNWIFDKLSAHIIYADRIETATIAISKGMEITDSATGKIFCVTIKNGEWDKQVGACAAVASSTLPVVDIAPIVPPVNTGTTTPPETVGTTTPPVIMGTSTDPISTETTPPATTTPTTTGGGTIGGGPVNDTVIIDAPVPADTSTPIPPSTTVTTDATTPPSSTTSLTESSAPSSTSDSTSGSETPSSGTAGGSTEGASSSTSSAPASSSSESSGGDSSSGSGAASDSGSSSSSEGQ